MHVHSNVEIDIDKISVCLILPMDGNCSKSLSFSKSKILTSTEFYSLDFHRLDPLFAKLLDPPPFLVILLICKYKNFPGSPDPAPTPTPFQICAWRELFYVWLETMSHRSFVQCIYKISMQYKCLCTILKFAVKTLELSLLHPFCLSNPSPRYFLFYNKM